MDNIYINMSFESNQSKGMEFEREIVVNGSEAVTGSTYGTNMAASSYYNPSNFILKNLFQQFHRLAILWFLIVSLLQLSTENPNAIETYSTVLPLCLLLCFTLLKEGYIDYLRHKEEAQHDNQVHNVWDGAKYVDELCKDLQVGEIILIKEGERVPADLVILAVSDLDQKCYVDSSCVQGEDKLECKLAIPDTQNIIEYADQTEVSSSIRRIDGQIHVGHPDRDLSKFEGKLKLRGNPVAITLTIENLLLRGSTLKFTPWLLGVIVYTGFDTKMFMNCKKRRNKASRTDKVLNLWVLGLVVALLVIMMIEILLNKVAYEHRGQWNYDSMNWVVLYYVHMFNHSVPIPLFFGIDIIRSLQAYTITKAMKGQVAFKTTRLNDDLGRVEYIIADKTGTITTGEIVLKAISIGGCVYWSQHKKPGNL